MFFKSILAVLSGLLYIILSELMAWPQMQNIIQWKIWKFVTNKLNNHQKPFPLFFFPKRIMLLDIWTQKSPIAHPNSKIKQKKILLTSVLESWPTTKKEWGKKKKKTFHKTEHSHMWDNNFLIFRFSCVAILCTSTLLLNITIIIPYMEQLPDGISTQWLQKRKALRCLEKPLSLKLVQSC